MRETSAVATASVAVRALVVRHRARRSRLYREVAEARRGLKDVEGWLLDLGQGGEDRTATSGCRSA